MSAADIALDALKNAMDSGQFDGQGPVVSVEFIGAGNETTAIPSTAPVTALPTIVPTAPPTLSGPTNSPTVFDDQLTRGEEDGRNLGLIIGLSVGGGVLLCCLCLGILLWLRRRNSQPPIGVIPDLGSSVGAKDEEVGASPTTRDQRDAPSEYESEAKQEEEAVAEDDVESEQQEISSNSSDSVPEDTQVV